MVYNAFFVTSGVGQSDVSELMAFDDALMAAGIHDVNLVPVSSILAENAVRLTEAPKFPKGEIVHCVMARKDEMMAGECAGLAWAMGTNAQGLRYGFVVEASQFRDQEFLKQKLQAQIQEMAARRQFTIETMDMCIAQAIVPQPHHQYISVIVVLVYCHI